MTRRWLSSCALLVLASACHEKRTSDAPLVYSDVKPLFESACLSCHGPELAEAGYSVESHYQVIGCVPVAVPATLPAGPDAPLLRVLERADHAELLSEQDRALLARWVGAGTPKLIGTVHPSGIADPRSPDWHGKLAAHDQFSPLRDASASDVCGRCHDGAPVKPDDVSFPAPQAPACNQCHDSPLAVLACDTCHGQAGAPYPPRDVCYFGEHGPDAHAAHLTGTRFVGTPLACDSCHQVPSPEVFEGDHANGKVEVAFARWPESSFDSASQSCAVYCHAQQGTLPSPHWNMNEKVDCQSCHQTPPPAHYPGDCSSCHAEMGTSADSLMPKMLHLNGQVDLGNGDESCGSCHGTASGGGPSDTGHQLHLQSPVTQPLVCSDCHPAPGDVYAPGHLDGTVQIALGARAQARGRTPVWSAADQRCSNVACHGAGLAGNTLAPSWQEQPGPIEQRCQMCHTSPPPPPHVQRSSCGGGLCHGEEVGLIGSQLRISESGRMIHIDGFVTPPKP